jgi:hypothetical protein
MRALLCPADRLKRCDSGCVHASRPQIRTYLHPIVNSNDARARRFFDNPVNFVRKYLLLKTMTVLKGGQAHK